MSTVRPQLGKDETLLLQESISRLKAASMRVTKPRLAMLTVLIRRRAPAPTESVHVEMGGACDLVTVYRSLGAMCKIGLLRRCFDYGGTMHYELALAPERLLVFDRARECFDAIHEAPSPEMRLALQRIEDHVRSLGYASVEHVVQFFCTSKKIS